MKAARGNLFSLLNLYLAVYGALVVFNLVLANAALSCTAHLTGGGPEQTQQEQALPGAQPANPSPARSPARRAGSHRRRQVFVQRIPDAYSGALGHWRSGEQKQHPALTTPMYGLRPAAASRRYESMPVSAGSMRQRVHFINGLERSKTFFIINGLTLTGQQGGVVVCAFSLPLSARRPKQPPRRAG